MFFYLITVKSFFSERFFRDPFGCVIEAVAKAVKVKKKKAFDGVRSGKSKKL